MGTRSLVAFIGIVTFINQINGGIAHALNYKSSNGAKNLDLDYYDANSEGILYNSDEIRAEGRSREIDCINICHSLCNSKTVNPCYTPRVSSPIYIPDPPPSNFPIPRSNNSLTPRDNFPNPNMVNFPELALVNFPEPPPVNFPIPPQDNIPVASSANFPIPSPINFPIPSSAYFPIPPPDNFRIPPPAVFPIREPANFPILPPISYPLPAFQQLRINTRNTCNSYY